MPFVCIAFNIKAQLLLRVHEKTTQMELKRRLVDLPHRLPVILSHRPKAISERIRLHFPVRLVPLKD